MAQQVITMIKRIYRKEQFVWKSKQKPLHSEQLKSKYSRFINMISNEANDQSLIIKQQNTQVENSNQNMQAPIDKEETDE